MKSEAHDLIGLTLPLLSRRGVAVVSSVNGTKPQWRPIERFQVELYAVRPENGCEESAHEILFLAIGSLCNAV